MLITIQLNKYKQLSLVRENFKTNKLNIRLIFIKKGNTLGIMYISD